MVAIVDSPAKATITWTDHSSIETNFTIEQSLNGTTGWTYIGQAAINAASFIARGPFAGSTTYFFRVKANSNANGSSDWSQIASVTTPAYPSQPKGISGSANSDSSITVSWADLPNEGGYRLEKFSNGVWTTLQSLNADVVSFTQNGLEEGTDYTYRVVAIENGVDSLPSDQLNVRTYLKSPINLAAQPISASRIDLSWVDLSDRETGYVVEQSVAGSNNWFFVERVNQNIHDIQAPGPFQGSVSYSFRVRAISANASSNASNPVTVATPAFPNTPSGLMGKALSDTSISLSWTLGTGITSYRIERAEKLYIGNGNWLPVQSLAGNQSSYVDSELPEGTTFGYRVIATNTIGDSSPSAELSVATMPKTPTGLTGTVVSGGKLDLTWVDQSHSEILFTVEQQASSSSSWVVVGTSQTNSVSLSGPFDGGVSYRFRVRAYSIDGGFSQYCEPFTLTTPNFPNQPLSFAATSLSTTEISFTWAPASNTDRYSLQKLQDNSTGIWTEVGTILGTNQSYSLIDLPEGYRGLYRLIAINLQGSSSPSQSVSAATNLHPPTGLTATAVSGGKIHLTWENLSTLRTGFAIEQSIDGLVWNPLNNPRISTTAFDASGPFKGSTPYYFRVKTVNDLTGTSSQYSSIFSVLTPAYPNQPGTLSAIALGPTEIKLTWQVVANAQSYKIQRSTIGQNEWTTIYTGQTGTLTFTDSALSECSTYSYRLIAVNGSGESAPSPVATTQTMLWSPGSLSASSNSGSTLDLTWINRSNFTSSITFEISTNNVDWLPLKVISGALTSASISKQLNGSTHYYIRAVTASLYPFNYSPYSTIEITTQSYPNSPNLNNPAVLTSNSVQLSWIDLPNEASYSLERKIDGSTLWSEVTTIQANNTSYLDINLSPSTKYTYRLSAVNNSGKSAYSDEVTALTLPNSINNISATLITEDRLDLNWSKPGKPIAIRIEASLSSTGPWSLVGVSNLYSATFSVPGPFISLTSYFFRLTAFNLSGNSEPAYVSFTTPALLSTPDYLWVESISSSSVELSWEAASQAYQYQILRRLTDGGWINIGQVSAGILTYTDTSNLNVGVLYQYGVAAIYDERTSGIARSGLVLSGNGTDDPDMDDLPNILEANEGTDPTKLDTDGDGFPDGWEFDCEVFDPTQPDDPEGDEDEDGLSNWEEYENGTDPGYGDSDEDGIEDALELSSGADPLDPSDEGMAPEPELLSKFKLNVGVPNIRLFQKWEVQVGNWTLTHTPGMVNRKEIQLKQGRSYPVYVRDTMHPHYGAIPDQPVWDWGWGMAPVIQHLEDNKYKPYFFSGDSQFFSNDSIFSDILWYRDIKAVLNLPSLDVDVDSDNTNAYNFPDESAYEDNLEGHEDTVKMLDLNGGNIDNDQWVIDYADFNGITGAHFTPIAIKLSDNVWASNPSDIRITFNYSASDPNKIKYDYNHGPVYNLPPEKYLRIWTKDAFEVRDPVKDFIPSDTALSASSLGLTTTNHRIVLFVEGVEKVDKVLPLEVEITVNGELWNGTLKDTVHFSVPKNVIFISMDSVAENREPLFNLDVPKEDWYLFLTNRDESVRQTAYILNTNPTDYGKWQGRFNAVIEEAESLAFECKTNGIDLTKLENDGISTVYFESFKTSVSTYDKYLYALTKVLYAIGNNAGQTERGYEPLFKRANALPFKFDGLKVSITNQQNKFLKAAMEKTGLSLNKIVANIDYASSFFKNSGTLLATMGALTFVASTGPIGAIAVLAYTGFKLSEALPKAMESRRDPVTGNVSFHALATDLSGITSLSLGLFGIDPVTGNEVNLTPEQAGEAMAGGVTGLLGLSFGFLGKTATGKTYNVKIPPTLKSGLEKGINATANQVVASANRLVAGAANLQKPFAFTPGSGIALASAADLASVTLPSSVSMNFSSSAVTAIYASSISLGANQIILMQTAKGKPQSVPVGAGGATPPPEFSPIRPDPNWRQSKPSSEKLNENLGGTPHDGKDAHHIIAGEKKASQPGRDLLEEFQLDINDRANGVLIQGGPGIPRSQGPSHRGSELHSTANLVKVNKRLERVISRSGNSWGKNRALLKAELEAIGREILNNQFP